MTEPTPEQAGPEETAHRALLVLARELDRLVAPLLAQLG